MRLDTQHKNNTKQTYNITLAPTGGQATYPAPREYNRIRR